MTSLVATVYRGEIALVTINNPPVNALGFEVRAALAEAFTALQENKAVAAIVLACAGRTFISGADIGELGTPRSRQSPIIADLCNMLDDMPKTTVAAFNGPALGGGLEVALCCHYRVANKCARVGLPEVKIGILPGAGGTVRLPRLIGPVKALEMIATGKAVDSAAALELGIVDFVTDGDAVDAAVAFAESALAAKTPYRRIRDREDKLAAVRADPGEFEALAADIKRKAKRLEAPVACANAVRNALHLSFDEAIAREREMCLALVGGSQARAQRHIFFAERRAAKVDGLNEAMMRPVARIGVVGAGLMGGGIAMSFANSGYPVVIVEMGDAALQRGLNLIGKNYDISVGRGSLRASEKAERMALIEGTTDYARLADCDLIIEAVFEDMAAKKAVFSQLERIAKPGAVLATNTSYLDVDEIAAATSRPQDVLGLHFFSPASVMKLVEVVRGRQTGDAALASALAAVKKISKTPVVVGVCPGFVGNRMLTKRSANGEMLLLEGATPSQMDEAFLAFGWPMGPFTMYDMAGLDIGWRKRKATGETMPLADLLCEQGRFGQKAGKGWYRYEAGSRTPLHDPAVDAMIDTTRRQLGIIPRQASADEIIERTLYPMISEGARILEERIAARSSDIDVIWTRGYGFPIEKGGPMFHANTIGLKEIVDKLRFWQERTGDPLFVAADSLIEKASSGQPL